LTGHILLPSGCEEGRGEEEKVKRRDCGIRVVLPAFNICPAGQNLHIAAAFLSKGIWSFFSSAERSGQGFVNFAGILFRQSGVQALG